MNHIHSKKQLTAGARSTLFSLLPKSHRNDEVIVNILQDSELFASRRFEDIYINREYSFCFFINTHDKKIEKVLPTHGKKYESLVRSLETRQELIEPTKNKLVELNFNELWDKVDNIREQAVELQKQLGNLSFYKEYYQEKIKMYDNQTSDLLHIIELGNFNASQGYALSKKLQEIRNKRRTEKSKFQTLVYFQRLLNDLKMSEGQDTSLNAPRAYKFREMSELQNFLGLKNASIKESSKLL